MGYPPHMHNSGTALHPVTDAEGNDGDNDGDETRGKFSQGEPSVVRLGVPRSDSAGTPGRKA